MKLITLALLVLLGACSHANRLPSGETTDASEGLVDFPSEEINERRTTHLREQGYMSYLRGDFPRAVNQLESSLLIEPQGGEAWPRYLLYYCYLITGDYRNALRVAEEVVRARPYQSLAYEQVGLAQLWMGQAHEAVQNFERALEFESHTPRVHFHLGLARAQLKQESLRDKSFTAAAEEYEQILKANPKDFTSNYELAALYLYWNRQIERASLLVNAARESIIQNPDEELPPERKLYLHYYVPLIEGILLSRKGETKSSQQALFHSLAHLPSGSKADIAEIYNYIGRNYRTLGEEKAAKTFFERGLATDPRGPYAPEMQRGLRELEAKAKKSDEEKS